MTDTHNKTILRNRNRYARRPMPYLNTITYLPAKNLRPKIISVGHRINLDLVKSILAILPDIQHPLSPVKCFRITLKDKICAIVSPSKQILGNTGRVLRLLERAAINTRLDIIDN